MRVQESGRASARPPAFTACPICNREFGSHSIDLHVAKCVQKNAGERKSKRRSKSDRRRPPTSDGEDEETPDSQSEDVSPARGSASARNRRTPPRRRVRRPGNDSRPRTAVLRRPVILDETLKDKVDMTMTKKQFLVAVKLCDEAKRRTALAAAAATASTLQVVVLPRMRPRPSRAAVGYRREKLRVRPSALGDIVLEEQQVKLFLPPTATRPRTKKLERPINAPTDLPSISALVRSDSVRISEKKNSWPPTASNSKTTTEKVPEPCRSCGKGDVPERLHRHHGSNSKSPAKKDPKKPSDGPRPSQEEKAPKKKLEKAVSLPKEVLSEADASSSPYETSRKRAAAPRGRRPVLQRTAADSGSSDADAEVKGSSSSESETPNKNRHKNEEEEKASLVVSDVSEPSSMSSDSSPRNSKPTCAACGKEFTEASLKFHEPQCQKKKQAHSDREKEEKEKEDGEQKASYAYFIETSRAGTPFQETFEAVWQAHVQQLVPCSKCKRTFFPDRIAVHEQSCIVVVKEKATNGKKNKGKSKGSKKQPPSSPRAPLVTVSSPSGRGAANNNNNLAGIRQGSPARSMADLLNTIDFDRAANKDLQEQARQVLEGSGDDTKEEEDAGSNREE